MIVVDASVVVELVLGSPAAEQVTDELLLEADRWHVPHLLDAEVALGRLAGRTASQDDLAIGLRNHGVLQGMRSGRRPRHEQQARQRNRY